MLIKRLIGALLLLLIIASCGGSGKGESNNNAANLSNKERQYFSNGRGLYELHCASCHMEEGQGLGRLIPPLKNADYLMKNVPGAARVIKYGLKDPIAVNGQTYEQPMPAHADLTPLEIAEILTFVSNSWGNAHGGVTVEEVKEALASGKPAN